VFDIAKHRPGAQRHNAPAMTLIELAPGVSIDEIRAKTEAGFQVA
jgi:acyl CoA:acetate/3-ketoacid CoA transferase beta subunit